MNLILDRAIDVGCLGLLNGLDPHDPCYAIWLRFIIVGVLLYEFCPSIEHATVIHFHTFGSTGC